MASIFTYDPNPPRVSSPWSIPQSSTPKHDIAQVGARQPSALEGRQVVPQVVSLADVGITKLDPEPQEGPIEYKLHLLLRPRTSAAAHSGLAAMFRQDDLQVSPDETRSPSPSAPALRPATVPSTHTRQNRLQHLTTQLLWRLQQSSPFHSSSSAELVLPVLPEATAKLGLPRKPSQLVPGLEESQGALYEIGVTDEGYLIGLTEEEMEESLENLKAMTASLGCHAEVLRKVLVGQYVPTADASKVAQKTRAESLWVTEVLVRPEFKATTDTALTTECSGVVKSQVGENVINDVRQSEVEQIRVSLAGASASGKSTLLGVLTNSSLDNGRGKSRLSLLKHRHEVSSGITSSVAQELLGYPNTHRNGKGTTPDIVNYGLADVASWNDIHSTAADGRLAFVSDSPGLPRYSKSTLRTLVSWKPHWTVFCVAATPLNEQGDMIHASNGPRSTAHALDVSSLSLSYLRLSLKMGLPLVLAVTKMDIVTKSSLRTVLAKILSLLKEFGRKPVILPSSSPSTTTDHQKIDEIDYEAASSVVNNIKEIEDPSIVPIVLVSSVNGMGIGMLHALLKLLPVNDRRMISTLPTSTHDLSLELCSVGPGIVSRPIFHVDEIFSIPVSRVYSPSSGSEEQNSGIVLCGHIAEGSINVGDLLILGPFGDADDPLLVQNQSRKGDHVLRCWARVRVMSIRNLRLSVRSLLEGQVGTIGVGLLPSTDSSPLISLTKARRGMVLTSTNTDIAHSVNLTFSALFPATDFEDPNSPPLIMGGQALAYINSIRAPVRVIRLERSRDAEDDSSLASSLATLSIGYESKDNNTVAGPDEEIFNYDRDEHASERGEHKDAKEPESETRLVKIGFAFLRWPECLADGDQVLIVPSTYPSTGNSLPSNFSGTSLVSGSVEKTIGSEIPGGAAGPPPPALIGGGSLAGFVGRIIIDGE